jgi:hypothetical protein
VWLRQGRVAEHGDDLKGFTGIWNGLDADQTEPARELLVKNFKYLIANAPSDKDLLTGFDLEAAAQSLKDGTSRVGSSSSLVSYANFQKDCASMASPNEIRSCDRTLRGLLEFGEADAKRLRTNLKNLSRDLNRIRDEESGAGDAAKILQEIHLPEGATEQCYKTFESDIIPKLNHYYLAEKDANVSSCKTAVGQRGQGAVYDVLSAQNEKSKTEREAIADLINQFNETCKETLFSIGNVDPNPVFTLSTNIRRVECVNAPNLPAKEVHAKRSAAKPDGGTAVARVVGKTPSTTTTAAASGGLAYFVRGGVPSAYNQDALEKKKTELGGRIDYAKGLPPSEKSTESAVIRREVDQFGSAYASSWEKYLRSIRLKSDSPADPGAWLQSLAQSTEWQTVLAPAAEALSVPGDPSDEYFGGAYRKLTPLSSVSTFMNAGLGNYTGLLKRVGQDLARCANSPELAGKYRTAHASGDPANSLVAAQNWVDQNGGFSLAQGSLQPLLQGPLEVAKAAMGSSADPNKSWTQLRSDTAILSQRFPFSGAETDNLASVDELKVVFGGLSGIVPKLFAQQDQLRLSPEAKDWLARAQKLSRIFFDPGKDEVNTYNLRVTLNLAAVSMTPTKAAESKDYRLEKFDFGMTDRFSWSPDMGMTDNKFVRLNLFGESAEDASKISIVVGQRGRKDKWTALDPPTVVASETGSWAPLKVLAKLKPPGAVTDSITLSMDAPFEFKKKSPPDGKLTVTIDVKGRELGTLLDVIKSGFPPAPPAQ